MERFPQSDEHEHAWPRLDIDLSGEDGNAFAVIMMARRLLEGDPLKQFNREIWEATQVGSGKTYMDMLAIVNSYMDVTDTSGMYEAYAPKWAEE